MLYPMCHQQLVYTSVRLSLWKLLCIGI